MLANLFKPRLRPAAALARRPAPTARRRAARRAVVTGLLAFALLTAALAAAAETVKPEWRDPEYGHRLRQVRQRAQKRPDRPLVVVLGSSRAQMGVSPHAMGFPDEPGQPLVYNFAYRGGFPIASRLQLARLLDDGVKPRAVVVVLATVESVVDGPAEAQYPDWGSRWSAADLRHLAPYIEDPGKYRRVLADARRRPWEARREQVVSDLLPDWQLTVRRSFHEGWERMDRYGWTPFPEERLTPEIRRSETAKALAAGGAINDAPVGAVSDRALRDLVGRCRSEGIAVALAWAPESPAYRAMYAAAGRAKNAAYSRTLTGLGVRVFPAPEHLEENDFADGYHLLPAGAAKYSRWLADTHLKPWLAAVCARRGSE